MGERARERTDPSRRTTAEGEGLADRSGPDAWALYCMDLYPTAGAAAARGVIELGRVATPFGVAVTPDGRHVHELTAWIEGLPEPAELGADSTFVAWATTPVLEPVVKLGAVGNGRTRLGRVAFNKFLILISLEADVDVRERHGRLVLRGRSPSMRMEAHDLLSQAPSAVRPSDEVAAAGDGRGSWPDPPMYPGTPMLPGFKRLAPRVRPLLPGADSLAVVPEARPRQLIDLPDGGTLDLEAVPVRRRVGGRDLLMFGFNGQHPGPLIRVPETATITVNFTNRTPFPTTIHWHGVRLDNRFDGVPGVTQAPVEPGATFRYRVYFRDAGIYWYHPHHREDLQQELGLYGNMLVEPGTPGAFGPVNREEVLMLDDLLLDERGAVPFGDASANYMFMGRFGNLFLVNGEPGYELEVRSGAVVRFFLTNVANTRTFNVSFVGPDGAGGREAIPVKVVASDVGRFEREERSRNVVLAPAERYVIEVRFPRPGRYALVNRVQAIDHLRGVFVPDRSELGMVRVRPETADPDHAHAFERLRTHRDVVEEIDAYRDEFDRPPDHELVLSLEVEGLPRPVEQVMAYDWLYFNPVEWAGTMPVMNWASTGHEVRWILRDPATGKENTEIDWRFRVGDVVKIRMRNDRTAFHAMQHPIHIHGQRFLVLESNGVPNTNLVWKDTVLLPAGSTTDILLEISNPGRWMLHCHIAEHLESGMKTVIEARPNPDGADR